MKIMKREKGRRNTSYGASKMIRRRIEQLAAQHDASMSFVQNTLLARQLGIDIGQAFDEPVKKER